MKSLPEIVRDNLNTQRPGVVYTPDLEQSDDFTIGDALDYHAESWSCLPECPQESHDSTCMILLAETLRGILPDEVLHLSLQKKWREVAK